LELRFSTIYKMLLEISKPLGRLSRQLLKGAEK
jgi:hypothetical protein